jgi:hypothetical protein
MTSDHYCRNASAIGKRAMGKSAMRKSAMRKSAIGKRVIGSTDDEGRPATVVG